MENAGGLVVCQAKIGPETREVIVIRIESKATPEGLRNDVLDGGLFKTSTQQARPALVVPSLGNFSHSSSSAVLARPSGQPETNT